MIPYRIIKQLREKGFPDIERIIWAPKPNINGFSTHFPILEELIEACLPEFLYLHNIDKIWEAGGGFYVYEKGIRGKTPEEAIAKLWLKLNKSK